MAGACENKNIFTRVHNKCSLNIILRAFCWLDDNWSLSELSKHCSNIARTSRQYVTNSLAVVALIKDECDLKIWQIRFQFREFSWWRNQRRRLRNPDLWYPVLNHNFFSEICRSRHQRVDFIDGLAWFTSLHDVLIRLMDWKCFADELIHSEVVPCEPFLHYWFQSGEYTSHMMISLHGNASHITGPLWGESTGHRLITLTKGQWCFDAFCWTDSGVVGDLRRHGAHVTWRHCNADGFSKWKGVN